jgi:hypothetical protein
MLMRSFTLFITLLLSASYASAENCDFKNLDFGINQVKLKKEFKLNTLDVATTGEGILNTGGADICDDLPPASVVEFLLLDNNFVQLTITTENKSGEILAYATKIFGPQDNTKGDKDKTRALWNEEGKYGVIYSAYKQGRHNLEKLVITSSNHQELFDKQNKADDKAMSEDKNLSKSHKE